MSCQRVLLVDLGQNACSSGNCGLLPRALSQWLRNSECLIVNNVERRADPPPDLVIIRPVGMESLLAHLRALRAQYENVPVLSVMCGSWSCGDLLECFTEGLDDFVECP